MDEYLDLLDLPAPVYYGSNWTIALALPFQTNIPVGTANLRVYFQFLTAVEGFSKEITRVDTLLESTSGTVDVVLTIPEGHALLEAMVTGDTYSCRIGAFVSPADQIHFSNRVSRTVTDVTLNGPLAVTTTMLPQTPWWGGGVICIAEGSSCSVTDGAGLSCCAGTECIQDAGSLEPMCVDMDLNGRNGIIGAEPAQPTCLTSEMSCIEALGNTTALPCCAGLACAPDINTLAPICQSDRGKDQDTVAYTVNCDPLERGHFCEASSDWLATTQLEGPNLKEQCFNYCEQLSEPVGCCHLLKVSSTEKLCIAYPPPVDDSEPLIFLEGTETVSAAAVCTAIAEVSQASSADEEDEGTTTASAATVSGIAAVAILFGSVMIIAVTRLRQVRAKRDAGDVEDAVYELDNSTSPALTETPDSGIYSNADGWASDTPIGADGETIKEVGGIQSPAPLDWRPLPYQLRSPTPDDGDDGVDGMEMDRNISFDGPTPVYEDSVPVVTPSHIDADGRWPDLRKFIRSSTFTPRSKLSENESSAEPTPSNSIKDMQQGELLTVKHLKGMFRYSSNSTVSSDVNTPTRSTPFAAGAKPNAGSPAATPGSMGGTQRRVALQQLNATSHTRTPTNFKVVQGAKKHSLSQSETAKGPLAKGGLNIGSLKPGDSMKERFPVGFDYRRSDSVNENRCESTDNTYARPRSTDTVQYSRPPSTDTVYEERPASTITVLAEPAQGLMTPVRGVSTDDHEA